MAERALRGSRLGAQSYETDLGVEMAPRQSVTYDVPPRAPLQRPVLPRGRRARGLGVHGLRRRGAPAGRHPARAEEGQAGPHPLGHAARAPQRQGARGAAGRAAGAAPGRHAEDRPAAPSARAPDPPQTSCDLTSGPRHPPPVARPGLSSSGGVGSAPARRGPPRPGTTRAVAGPGRDDRRRRPAIGPTGPTGPKRAAVTTSRRPQKNTEQQPAGQRPGRRQHEEEARRRR